MHLVGCLIVAPIVWELVFRGFLLQFFTDVDGAVVGLIAGSHVFGLVISPRLPACTTSRTWLRQSFWDSPRGRLSDAVAR